MLCFKFFSEEHGDESETFSKYMGENWSSLKGLSVVEFAKAVLKCPHIDIAKNYFTMTDELAKKITALPPAYEELRKALYEKIDFKKKGNGKCYKCNSVDDSLYVCSHKHRNGVACKVEIRAECAGLTEEAMDSIEDWFCPKHSHLMCNRKGALAMFEKMAEIS